MKRYIYIGIISIVSYLIINSIYQEITKDKVPGKAKRLDCQKRVTTFERVYGLDEVKIIQDAIKNGNIDFTSSVEKSIHMRSVLFEYISLKQTDQMFNQALFSYVKKEPKIDITPYKLSYTIYENDKLDPGKKTKKSKQYTGYVVLELKNKTNQIIYKVQIDFMDHKASDISQSINCAVKSLMSITD